MPGTCTTRRTSSSVSKYLSTYLSRQLNSPLATEATPRIPGPDQICAAPHQPVLVSQDVELPPIYISPERASIAANLSLPRLQTQQVGCPSPDQV